MLDTYHGYGIQNFLDVDPHFGRREDLALVAEAHAMGLRVILDIILNHVGNVFSYEPNRYWTLDPHTGRWFNDPRWDGHSYQFKAFHDADGQPTIPYNPRDRSRLDAAWPEGAIWPIELQDPAAFRRKGRIVNWDYYPEYVQGDFNILKGLYLGEEVDAEHFRPSETLQALTRIYQFWIAFADLDGFRIDSVKHMGVGATRWFCSAIREFTQTIGKERFLLIGEVAGSGVALETVERTGLDAGLGIVDIPDRLEALIKGERDAGDYFGLFRNSTLVKRASHTWFGKKVVTMFDDHDQVHNGSVKGRFCVDSAARDLAFSLLALNLTTLGIPCIYYGSEQGFDSGGRTNPDDRILRENMFGGSFGAFCTQGRHFFNESGRLYRAVAQLLQVRQQSICLRRGRQYLLPTSTNGEAFHLPRIGDHVAGPLVCWGGSSAATRPCWLSTPTAIRPRPPTWRSSRISTVAAWPGDSSRSCPPSSCTSRATGSAAFSGAPERGRAAAPRNHRRAGGGSQGRAADDPPRRLRDLRVIALGSRRFGERTR